MKNYSNLDNPIKNLQLHFFKNPRRSGLYGHHCKSNCITNEDYIFQKINIWFESSDIWQLRTHGAMRINLGIVATNILQFIFYH